MDYDECRAKISIIDIAEDLGYTRIWADKQRT